MLGVVLVRLRRGGILQDRVWCNLIARGGGVLAQQGRCGVVVDPYHRLGLLVRGGHIVVESGRHDPFFDAD